MFPNDSNTKNSDCSLSTEKLLPEDYTKTEEEEFGEQSEEEEIYDYEPTEEEHRNMCKAFTILDEDGDGVIEPSELGKLLLSWGRMPMGEELKDIMRFANDKGCEGSTGMNFENFQKYLKKQLANTSDEEELRQAFEVFDSDPLTGKLNLSELRHYLKYQGMKLTDDEIDYLFKEEDYWMLAEKDIFEYEQLIDKIFDKPTCNSPFLNCLNI